MQEKVCAPCRRMPLARSPDNFWYGGERSAQTKQSGKQLGEAPAGYRKPHVVREPLAPLTNAWQKASRNSLAVTLDTACDASRTLARRCAATSEGAI